MQKTFPLFLASAASAIAAQTPCSPTSPTTCYSSPVCDCQYCLGPAKTQGNAPVGPRTCNGDFIVQVSGFYWNAHEDGLEYAVRNSVKVNNVNNTVQAQTLNNLVSAKYENPHFDWEFGFKVGLGYNTTCDGWDLGINWTHFRPRASTSVEAGQKDNLALITLWSASNLPANVIHNVATRIDTQWNADLNLIDLELGREFWTSPRFTMRPFIGIRIGFLDQNYHLQHFGGTWAAIRDEAEPRPLTNEVDLQNDYHGAGLRTGLDLKWHLGCGWAFYSNLATSILYGRFDVGHDETNRLATTPFTKTRVLDTSENFHASRAILDLGLGIQWAALICKCKYGLAAMLGWEQHLLFNQNQLWRVRKVNTPPLQTVDTGLVENVYFQRRGNFDTEGWTLTLRFEF